MQLRRLLAKRSLTYLEKLHKTLLIAEASTNPRVMEVVDELDFNKLQIVREELSLLHATGFHPSLKQLQYLWAIFASQPFTKRTLEDVFGTLRSVRNNNASHRIGNHRPGVFLI